MIETLKIKVVELPHSKGKIEKVPNAMEIMDKINEIIEAINYLERSVVSIQGEHMVYGRDR